MQRTLGIRTFSVLEAFVDDLPRAVSVPLVVGTALCGFTLFVCLMLLSAARLLHLAESFVQAITAFLP